MGRFTSPPNGHWSRRSSSRTLSSIHELEDVYQLGYGIKASAEGSVDTLCKRVEEIVEMKADERQQVYQTRRQKMLDDKIDCAKFLTWFIEGYPATVKEVRGADKSFWGRFK